MLFSKLFSEKGCFSRISEGTQRGFGTSSSFRAMVFSCRELLLCFFRSCFPASGRRQQKFSKNVVFLGFQTGRQALFWRGFGTSSSFRAMVFSCRELLFSKLFSCERPQATEILEKSCFMLFYVVFLGFQKGRQALFWRGFGTSSSFRAMVFSCRELLFSKLFSCERPQATEILEKGCFSRISDGTLGTFLAWFWNQFVLQSHGVFLPGAAFFEVVFLRAAAGNRNSRKRLFFLDFRRDVRHFFGVVLELARPSEPWCFPAGSCFFRSCFPASGRRQQKFSKKVVLLGFQTRRQALFWRGFGTSSSFRAMVFSCRELLFSKLFSCEKGCSSFRAMVFSCRGLLLCFFRSCFRKKVVFLGFQKGRQALFWRGFGTSSSFRAIVFSCRELLLCFFRSCFPASGRRQQKFSKNVVFLGFQTGRQALFWRGFGTSSSFRAMVFSCRGISDGTLGTFLAWFWNQFVLQSHGVFLPGAAFFAVVFLRAAAGNRKSRKRLFFQDFRRDVRHFFGVVLELARPSEPWCFPAGSCFFRSCFPAKKVVFLGFQTGRQALFWRGCGTSSSFRAIVFSCRELLFSKLFSCERPQATEILEKGCFSRISEGTLGTFLAWFWNQFVLQSHGVFLPGAAFFEVVFLRVAAGNRNSRKKLFFWDFRRDRPTQRGAARRQQQAAGSRQQQTQADAAAVSAMVAVQQLAARKIVFFQDGTNGCQERGQEHAKGAHSQQLAASASSSQQPVASSLPKI